MGAFGLRPLGRGRAAALAGLISAVMLWGCEEQTYPTASNTEAPPAQSQTALMGAPEAVVPPAEAPPPVAEAPPPPPPFRPRTMAPIPNPGDPGSEGYYAPGRGEGDAVLAAETPPPALAGSRRRRHARVEGEGEPAVAADASEPAPSRAAVVPPPSIAPPPRRAALSAPGVLRIPRRPAKPAGSASADPSARSAGSAAAVKSLGDRAPRLEALRRRLSADLARAAVLRAPDRPSEGTPFEATLTVPASFLDQLRYEAQSQGLNDEAASASLTAQLQGAGYGMMPASPQTLPLMSGQPTVFRWTVTRQGATAAGPLQAEVTSTLLGGGSYPLDLGTVSKGVAASSGPGARILGAGLLVIVAGIVAFWLLRSRHRNGESALARRARAEAPPPLDLSPDPPQRRP